MMGKAGMLGLNTSTEMGGHGADFKFASIVDEEQYVYIYIRSISQYMLFQ